MAMSDTTRPDGEKNDPLGEDEQAEPFAPDDEPFAEGEASINTEDAPDTDDEALQTEELELSYEDTRLPWLEGDDEEEERGSFASGQFVALVVLSLVALALIGGGIWWATRASPDGDLVADGSVIEAPDEPYKQRPDDPGGKTFEGTGDSSFALSEGEERPVQLDDGPTAAKPGFDTVGSSGKAEGGNAAAQSTTSATSAAEQPSGVGVQVGAYSTRASAEQGWTTLSRQYEVLSGVNHRIVEGRADIGTVYRLQAVPGGLAEGKALCKSLQSAGLNCHVKQ